MTTDALLCHLPSHPVSRPAWPGPIIRSGWAILRGPPPADVLPRIAKIEFVLRLLQRWGLLIVSALRDPWRAKGLRVPHRQSGVLLV